MGKKIPPRVVGQIEYFTSPYEQKLFADIFDVNLIMTKLRRKVDILKDMAPALIIFASVYSWGNKTHEKLARESRY